MKIERYFISLSLIEKEFQKIIINIEMRIHSKIFEMKLI
jgi:hypothetical protein